MFRKFAVFHRKDNIKGVQELSTANLFNIKKANFLPCDRDRSLSVETEARFTKARRRSRNAQKIIYMYQLVASYFRDTPHCQGL